MMPNNPSGRYPMNPYKPNSYANPSPVNAKPRPPAGWGDGSKPIQVPLPAMKPDDWRRHQRVGRQPHNSHIGLIVGAVILAIVVLVVAVVVFLGKGSSTDNGALQAVQQPATAAQVASQLGCTDFKAGDVGGTGMVESAGTCMKNGKKMAIDVFASKEVRDQWLKAAEPLGVKPAFESNTSVTYPSVNG